MLGRSTISESGVMGKKVVGVLLALAVAAAGFLLTRPERTDVGPAARLLQERQLLEDRVRSPGWTSGAWIGGNTSAEAIHAFGTWRGTPARTVTTYPAYATWEEIAGSEWHVTTFDGWDGRLVYGLPLLPTDVEATLADVAAGQHDDVWREVAATLTRHGRPDTFVRIGLEANGTWFPWGATAAEAKGFKAAFRHVAEVLKREQPRLRIVFDISCGVKLAGATDRLASLTELYPGDDVVDVIGCDHYDSYSAKTRNQKEWDAAVAPPQAAGLQDLVVFARGRSKQFAVPEWGLSGSRSDGSGDNPFFIAKMHEFFTANREALAFENYFDEPDEYLSSSLFQDPEQNPESAKLYRTLWSTTPRETPESPSSSPGVTGPSGMPAGTVTRTGRGRADRQLNRPRDRTLRP
jgi:hypothetical protein